MVVNGNQWAFRQHLAVQTVPEGSAGGVMTNTIWMLVHWAVFAVAAGVKFRRLTSARRRRGESSTKTEQLRRSLERI